MLSSSCYFRENHMSTYRRVIYSLAASVAVMPFAFGQSPPPADTTSPSAASSPHQRDATSTRSPEAPTGNGTNPAAASSPHQHQATSGQAHQTGKNDAKQTMKACIAREQADHTGMTMADARKSCKEQLKASPQK
jgi:hypothetical protein